VELTTSQTCNSPIFAGASTLHFSRTFRRMFGTAAAALDVR
jgi:hypothetical protein